MAVTHTLPTLDRLQATIPDDLDAKKVASAWLESFSQFVSANDIDGILSILHSDAWWRDLFILTWDLRTFQGLPKIKQFLQDRLAESKFSNLKLTEAKLDRPYPDLAWISLEFDFTTAVAQGKSIVRLVPTPDGQWKGYLVWTNLESLTDYPEKVGPLRNFAPNHGKWLDQRRREKEFADSEPDVLIIGGGQSGLDLAARLKHLNVSNLIIEKQQRVGDQWRNRYAALCLHDPVCKCNCRLQFEDLPIQAFLYQGSIICPTSREAFSRNVNVAG